MKSQTFQEFKEQSGHTIKAIARACKCNRKIISDLLKKEHITVMYDARAGTLAIYDRGILDRTGNFNNDHKY